MAIIKCTCEHEAQDKLHGKKMRVYNPTVKGYRCTVCLKELDKGINIQGVRLNG